jgi:Chemotaxis phosphatase CheX
MSAPAKPYDLTSLASRSLETVFSTQLGRSLTLCSGVTEPSGAPDERLCFSVPWSGSSWHGVFALAMPLPFAAEAAAQLFGRQPGESSPEELADVAAELCNMVAGRVSFELSQQGFPGLLQTPVVRSDQPENAFAAQGEHCRTDWTCAGHPLTLDIALFPSP